MRRHFSWCPAWSFLVSAYASCLFCCHPQTHSMKSPAPFACFPTAKSWGAAGRTPKAIFTGWTRPAASAHRSSDPDPDPLGGRPLHFFPFINVFCALGGSWNWTHCCRCGLTSTAQRGIIPSLYLRAMLLLIHPRLLPAHFTARARCWLMHSSLSANTPGPFPQSCSPASLLSFIYPPLETVKSQLTNKNIVEIVLFVVKTENTAGDPRICYFQPIQFCITL